MKDTPADSDGSVVETEGESAGAVNGIAEKVLQSNGLESEIGQSVSENLVETILKPDCKVTGCLEGVWLLPPAGRHILIF